MRAKTSIGLSFASFFIMSVRFDVWPGLLCGKGHINTELESLY